MSALVGVNHFYFQFVSVGNDHARILERENQVLREHIVGLTSRMSELETSLNKLDVQGNQLRLMVDLQTVDTETKKAGSGGAVTEPDVRLTSDSTARLLHGAFETAERLTRQVKIEEQSYGQIVKKYEYNKGYFAALPALKPMAGYYSVKEFGLRMHPVLGIFKTHEGLDIVNDVGSTVVAAGDGIVQMAGQSGGGYGTVVVINHGYGYQTLYAHLSKVLVREGHRVKRGEVIGKSGRTGLVSGPHLHYEVRYNGICQNPANFFFDDVTAQEYQRQVALK